MTTRRHTTTKLKRRKEPTDTRPGGSSAPNLQKQLDQRTRELAEALEQQAATSEILSVISGSPTDAQPVYDAIVESGLKLFPGATIIVALADGDSLFSHQ